MIPDDTHSQARNTSLTSHKGKKGKKETRDKKKSLFLSSGRVSISAEKIWE